MPNMTGYEPNLTPNGPGRTQAHRDHTAPETTQTFVTPTPPSITQFWDLDHTGETKATGMYGTNKVTGIVNTADTFNANYAAAAAKYQAAMAQYWQDFQAAAQARENAAGN